MISLYFLSGMCVGAVVVLSIQQFYKWISGLRKEVDSLRNQIEYLQRIKEDWVEFNFWKRNNKETT